MAKDDDDVGPHLFCFFERMRNQSFADSSSLIIRANREGAEGNAILDRPVFRDEPSSNVKDAPNDFSVDFRDKIQFGYEVGVVSKQMRKIMLGRPRHVHVPKGLANHVLDNGVILFSLKAYPKVRHGKVLFHAYGSLLRAIIYGVMRKTKKHPDLGMPWMNQAGISLGPWFADYGGA